MFLHNEDWEILAAAIPGTIMSPQIYGKDVVIGRLTTEESSNQYATGQGALHSRALTYNDAHGYNFISRATFGRETGDLHRHFVPRVVGANENTRWLRNLVLTETDSTSADAANLTPILAQSTYGYSPEGALIQRTDLLQRRDGSGTEAPLVTERGYDTFGNVIFVEDPNDNRTEFCYDGDVNGTNWCPNDFGQSTHSVGVAMKDAFAIENSLNQYSTFEPDPVSGAIIEVVTAFSDDPDLKLVRDAFDRVIEERVLTAGAGGASFLRKSITFDDHASPTPTVDETTFADRVGSMASAVTSTSVDDGFGGTWKTIQESPSGFFGTFTFRDPANNKVIGSRPTVCAGDLCAGFTGDESSLNVTETVSDSMGRPLSVTNPGNELALFAYASATRAQPVGGGSGDKFDVVLGKNAKGDLNQRHLDGDRVVWAEECSNVVVPELASLSAVTCETPDTTFYTYQASGEIDTVYDAIATSVSQGYNDASHHLTYHFDTVGRVRQIDDPNLLQPGEPTSGKTLIDYDLAGNVWRRWNGRGQMTETHYDALNRPTWIYPPAGESISQTTYRAGERRPEKVTSDLAQNGSVGTYTMTFTYDDLGRVAQKKYDGSYWNSRTLLLDFAYDELGRPVDVRYPDDQTIVHYEYDGAYLSGVCEVPTLGDDCTDANAVDYIDNIAYDTLGRRTSVAAPSGTRSYQYDPVTYRLTQDAFAGANANYGRTLEYEYDALGNLYKIKTPSGPTQDPSIDFAATYTYDSRNRLSSWAHGGTTHGYDYDALGNLTHHESGSANQTFDHATKPNAITRRPNADPALDKTYAYDADGNLLSEVSGTGIQRHYTFDGQNRLTCVGTVAGGCQTRIVSYDAAGTRIRDRDPATNTDRFFTDDYFVLDVDVSANSDSMAELRIFAEGQQIARKIITSPLLRAEPLFVLPWPRLEVRPTGGGIAIAITASALLVLLGWGMAAGTARDEPVSALLSTALALALVFPPGIAFGGGGGSASVRHWFLNDHLGSANAWITEDGFGVMRVVYTPFGKVHQEDAQSPVNRIFAGHPVDDATGLHYMKARWSNSETGTFLSIDPLVASQSDPQAYNAYAYARNNPIALVDPEGARPYFGAQAGPGGPTRVPGVNVGDSKQVGSPKEETDAGSKSGDAPSPATDANDGPDINADRAGSPADPAPDKGASNGGGGFWSKLGGYLKNMLVNDLKDAAGLVIGPIIGILDGLHNIAMGIVNMKPLRIALGIGQIAAVAMPRLGGEGGLLYPSPNPVFASIQNWLSNDSQLGVANRNHDAKMPGGGYFSSAAHFGWIVDAFSNPGNQPGPAGQAYRILGTVGFGVAGAVLAPFNAAFGD